MCGFFHLAFKSQEPQIPNCSQMNTFKYAIVREPPPNFADGQTTSGLGKPDYELTLAQHAKYCSVLEECGLELLRLPCDSRYPDSCFVEDTAVIIDDEHAVITIPGHAARNGEQHDIAGLLAKHKTLMWIMEPGTLDGGDVLRMGDLFYIGLSDRTNDVGARQFSDFLRSLGKTPILVPLSGVLHLKTGITSVGDNAVVCIEQFYAAPEFKEIAVKFSLPENEKNGGNCLCLNGSILVPDDCPQLISIFKQDLSSPVIPMPLSEFQKMDGGLSCLSIRF